MYVAFFVILIVEILGAIIIRSTVRQKVGENEACEAEGFYYFGIGCILFFWIEDMLFSGYLSREERMMRDVLQYCGIIDMIVGGVLILKGIIAGIATQQQNQNSGTTNHPQSVSDIPKLPVGWKCQCGHTNPQENKFCGSCGQKQPEPKPTTWACECGHKNPLADKYCGACGKKVAEVAKEPEVTEQMTTSQGHIIENEVWICCKCGKRNLLTRPTCWYCDCARDL